MTLRAIWWSPVAGQNIIRLYLPLSVIGGDFNRLVAGIPLLICFVLIDRKGGCVSADQVRSSLWTQRATAARRR